MQLFTSWVPEPEWSFGLALLNGELEASARKSSPLGEWVEIPAGAWPHFKVLKWSTGELGHRQQANVTDTLWTRRRGGYSFPAGFVSRQISAYERYYDVRVARPQHLSRTATDARGTQTGRPLPEDKVRRWIAERLDLGNQQEGLEAMLGACKQELGGKIPRQRFGELRIAERNSRGLPILKGGRPAR